jgi:hypothetical protein
MTNRELHKYSKHRPPWCNHPPFKSIDYCWGLALAVDERKKIKFLKDKCSDCDQSKYYYMEGKEAYDKGFRDRVRINLILNPFIGVIEIERELLNLPNFTGYDPPMEEEKPKCKYCGMNHR